MPRHTLSDDAARQNGIELKVARTLAGLKQYELAAQIGMGPTELSMIETGRIKPSPEKLARIMACINEAAKHQPAK